MYVTNTAAETGSQACYNHNLLTSVQSSSIKNVPCILQGLIFRYSLNTMLLIRHLSTVKSISRYLNMCCICTQYTRQLIKLDASPDSKLKPSPLSIFKCTSPGFSIKPLTQHTFFGTYRWTVIHQLCGRYFYPGLLKAQLGKKATAGSS